jgi:DNA-binding response OmpR family regulator
MCQTIMIAANDPNITYLLQRYAEESGFQTVSACHGRDVLALAHRTRPALIILDIDLPGTPDRKLLYGLKAEATTRDIPVVVYSCMDESLEDWGEGASDILPKSVMYDDFVAVLERTGIRFSRQESHG